MLCAYTKIMVSLDNREAGVSVYCVEGEHFTSRIWDSVSMSQEENKTINLSPLAFKISFWILTLQRMHVFQIDLKK